MPSQAHKLLVQRGIKILINIKVPKDKIFVESHIPKDLHPKYCVPDVVGILENKLIAVECGEIRDYDVRNKNLYDFYDRVIHLPYLKHTKHIPPEKTLGRAIVVGEEKNKSKLLIFQRKLARIGGSIMIAVPKEWANQHSLKQGDEVSIMLNKDMKILSPETEKRIYKQITDELGRQNNI